MLRSRIVLATFLMGTCAACGHGEADPSPAVGRSPSTSAPSTSMPSIPPELQGYTTSQRAAYEAAVKAYAKFVRYDDHLYAVGKTTVGAKDFYQRYSIDWATAWANLAQVENNKVTVTGPTKVLWSKPVSIDLGKSPGDVIVLQRCLDETKRVVKQDGKRVAQPQLKKAHLYTVRLQKNTGESRWRAGEPEQGSTC